MKYVIFLKLFKITHFKKPCYRDLDKYTSPIYKYNETVGSNFLKEHAIKCNQQKLYKIYTEMREAI